MPANIFRVKVTSNPDDYRLDSEGSPIADFNLFTFVVNDEQIALDLPLDEAITLLDYYTPAFYSFQIVLGNLQCAARDGKIEFEVDAGDVG